MPRKKLFKIITIICILSISLNLIQFAVYKMNTSFCNRDFGRCLGALNSNLDLYEGQPFGSEESIKDSISLITTLEARSLWTSYKYKTKLSLMSELLKNYFKTNNDETIRKNSIKIKQYISAINKDINKSNKIDEFITYLTSSKQKQT